MLNLGRREFITLLGSTPACPLAAGAQQSERTRASACLQTWLRRTRKG
jgi:hypothetical protein